MLPAFIMTKYFIYITYLVICYLIGAFPSGYIFYKIKTGRDIREEGSRKNIGTTNVFVCGGVFIGIITMVFDIIKGFLPVLIGQFYFHNQLLAIFGGIIAVVGHVFPVYIGFRGGTGLATSMGALIALIPQVMGSFLITFLVVTPILKRPALLGMILMIIMPFYAYILGYSPLMVGVCSLMAIGYVVISVNHIGDMLKGKEYKEVMSLLLKTK